MVSAARQRRPRLRDVFQPHRIVISLIVAVALGLLWLGFAESRDGTDRVVTRPAEVLRVFPVEGDPLRLRQEPVGFVLAEGYTGELRIDGVDIPLDQLERPNDPVRGDNAPPNRGLAGLNQISFTPAPGKEIEALAPGEHTATALYWRQGIDTREDARSYTWRFRVS